MAHGETILSVCESKKMTKLFWNILKVSPAVLAATVLTANSAIAADPNQQLVSADANIGQVTSVSQFSDVQPTDWAFQALQSLVERYGCIAGYPNGTFRGNRALTRYEFAAGLNSCLDRVNELIATSSADLVKKEDLATLQRLQEEYSAELATLRGRVDALEARTAELEANQFSTTTKLSGEAIFGLSQAFGDHPAAGYRAAASTAKLQSNTTFSDRVRLSLNTSFTGSDQLQTRLQATNVPTYNRAGGITGTNATRLSYDPNSVTADNSVTVDKLNYAFNPTKTVRVKIDAVGAELNENVNVFNPDFASSGKGALSAYGRFSPIYRQAANGAGITFNVNPDGPLSLSAAYIAQNRNSAANPADGQGLFNGDNTMFAQLGLKPNKAVNVGLTYAHTYERNSLNLLQGTGSAFANNPFVSSTFNPKIGGVGRIESSNYGIEVSLQPTTKVTLGGWAGYTTASALNGNNPASTDIWYWAGTLAVKDFGKEGNVLGLIFGQPPKATGGHNIKSENGTSYHLEGLYKVKVSDHIQVTPGVLVIFNPENNNNNSTEYVGTLRTTFSF
jgi:hypothetical protein